MHTVITTFIDNQKPIEQEIKKMDRSENINELATALNKAQGEIKPAIKDANNPFFKSRYADLAAVYEVCREPLNKNGLSITQHPSAEDNKVTVESIVMHTSGQWMGSRLTMTAKDFTPQGIGSAITYARRYALSSILGIASEEDDDANKASGRSVAPVAVKAEVVPAAPVATSAKVSAKSMQKFQIVKAALGDDEFKTILKNHGVQIVEQIASDEDAQVILRDMRVAFDRKNTKAVSNV